MKRRALKLLNASNGRPRLDRYELVAELAAGGMATVFLARIGGAGGFQRFVAIKRLHPHLAHEHDFVDMFLDEARLAAGIHHPNVVPILEVGESAAGYYQVMEYIEGDTLANLDRVAEGLEPAPLPVLLRIAVDAAMGLHAAHERKDERGQLVQLVHRDVSPQNILVGVDGTSRITDFGVARATTRLSSTRSGDLKGKLAYMAPEQVLGEPDLDRRADVFAMGVVIWELLAREHLFRGPNDAATMNRVLREPIPDVRSKRPDVPAAVAEIVARTLLREKTLRPATAAELAEALRGAGVPLATTTAVADYVEQLLGPSIVERREAVRAWLSASHDDREQRGPRSPEPVFDSPTLEMERPALPGDAGSPTIGAETGGASVVTSGGISSGPRLRREQGSLFPLVLSGVAVLIVVALGVLRFVGGASEKPAATLPPPSDSARETARSAAEAASTQSPVPSATASVVKQPDETPPTATAEASASARSTTRPPGQKKPARGAAPVPTDLAASPY